LHATHIAVAQFTNFTQDHLDYHESMEAYWLAKRALFDWPGLRPPSSTRTTRWASWLSTRAAAIWTSGPMVCRARYACRLRI
jgi:UDP-N-acetylmuramyl tripeptide synthase